MNCPRCQYQTLQDSAFCESCGEALPVTDPMLGRILGEKYKITRQLGKGGFGAVYEATNLRLENKVAIKTLHNNLVGKQQLVERFRREALATGRITNPNAVKVFDRGATEDGTFWLAMEFISGESLDAYLDARGPLSEAELLELFGPICDVLSEAHEKGIIHRDLKPQNIMLMPLAGGKFTPKVLDFGIASLREEGTDSSLTGTGTVSGTPKYMAPEQWESLKKTDARSDVYSLAMMAYQCLSGRLPYEADSPLGWMKQHNFGTPISLQEAASQTLSPVICAAVMQGIEKDPSNRPQSISFFKQLLFGEISSTYQAVVAPSAKAPKPLEPTLPSLTTPEPQPERPREPPDTLHPTNTALPLAPAGRPSLSLGVIAFSLVAITVGLYGAGVFTPKEKVPTLASVPTTEKVVIKEVFVPTTQQTPASALVPTSVPVDPVELEAQAKLDACLKAFQENHLEDANAACSKIPTTSKVYAENTKEIKKVVSQHDKQKLWEKITGLEETKDRDAMCVNLLKYLSRKDLTIEEKKQANARKDKYDDSELFPKCNPQEK